VKVPTHFLVVLRILVRYREMDRSCSQGIGRHYGIPVHFAVYIEAEKG
jgi:hypothetical protein